MDFWAFLRGGVVSLHLLLLPLESHINLTLQMFDSLVYMNIQSPLFVPDCFVSVPFSVRTVARNFPFGQKPRKGKDKF